MSNKNIYINISNVQTADTSTFELDQKEYYEIISESGMKQFTQTEIVKNFIQYFKTNSDYLFILAGELVNRHLKSLDKGMSEMVKSEKHNCFTILIDGNMAFVFGSTVSDTIEYSKQHGEFLYITYKQTI